MPRQAKIPSYRLHRPSGQARVIVDGRHVYLGPYGTPKSQEAYAHLIAERFSPAVRDASPASDDGYPDLTVNELLVAYLDFASTYYAKDGRPTKELTSMKEAMGPLSTLYGSLPARHFRALKLQAVRQRMLDQDLSRGVINHHTHRLRRIFKWAVSRELLPPAVYESLRSVDGLRKGQARETEPVKPVADRWVDAVLPYLSPPVKAMVELQRLTGMRPGEVITMRPCDIDRSSDIAVYLPHEHKNEWRGHRRHVPLGPRAWTVVEQFLSRQDHAFLFSPREAEEWRQEQRRHNRKSPMTPSQAKRKPKKRPKRAKRECYDTDSYRRAVAYGIAKANRARTKLNPDAPEIPHWHPSQLRHTFATAVREQFGVEAAQIGLGHARTDVVEVYAEKNLALATEIARKVG